MTAARELVDGIAAQLQPLDLALQHAWWDANTDANDATEQQRVAAEMAYLDALADADTFAAIRDARTNNAAGDDAMVGRQLAILHDAYAPNQIDPELQQRIVELDAAVEKEFTSHRGTIAGELVDDNTIERILRTSADVGERREAWEASKSVGELVASRVRELAKLRNQAARDLGYRDHFALTLATTELDEARLFATLDEVDALTSAEFTGWKAALDDRLAAHFGCAAAELRPWHYDNPFFQQPPAIGTVDLDAYFAGCDLSSLTARTYGGLGFAIDHIVERSDLLPRAGKSQHAFCMDMDRAGDVRVLTNNEPNERWAETMLHEFGHAVYFDLIDRSLPWVLRTVHSLATEGIAMLFGRLVHDGAWLRTIAGVPARDVELLAPQLAAARRADRLVFARWALVMTNFERALYADPDRDLDTLWWDLVERYQQTWRPDDRHAPDWAAKIHIARVPVYYQNYLYGELVASQLQASLGGDGALIDQSNSAAILQSKFFAPGASLRWDRLVEHATGAPLDARAFARELAA